MRVSRLVVHGHAPCPTVANDAADCVYATIEQVDFHSADPEPSPADDPTSPLADLSDGREIGIVDQATRRFPYVYRPRFGALAIIETDVVVGRRRRRSPGPRSAE